MLTDDELTRELGHAFHSVTADLTYSGRVPAPRRSGMIAIPAAAAGVAVVALVGFAATSGGDHPQAGHQPTALGESKASGTDSHRHLTSHTLKLAGYSFSYQEPSGDTPLYGLNVNSVPSDATPVQGDDPSTQDYVGVDPSTGYNAGWVEFGDGTILEITSPDATQDQVQQMVVKIVTVVRASPSASSSAAS
jgi:hypothetical protein